jgi:hypothetical protein
MGTRPNICEYQLQYNPNKKAETSQQPNSSPVSTPVFFLNLQCCEDEREREWMLDKMKNLVPIKTQKERKKMNRERNTHSLGFAFPLKVLCSTVEQQHQSSIMLNFGAATPKQHYAQLWSSNTKAVLDNKQVNQILNLKKLARTPHETPPNPANFKYYL